MGTRLKAPLGLLVVWLAMWGEGVGDRAPRPPRLLLPLLVLLLSPLPQPLLLTLTDAADPPCETNKQVEESPPQPNTSFLSNNNTLIQAIAGESIVLPCRVHQTSSKKVAWLLQPEHRLLTVQERTFTQDKRITAQYFRQTELWTLYIVNSTVNDTGTYECQLSSHPWVRLYVRLKVTDPNADNTTVVSTDPVITKDYYEPGFRISGAHLCPSAGDDAQLVMMVQSRPGNLNIRRTLRRTWARPAIQRTDVVLAFLVARTNDSRVQHSIEKEAETFADIVQANFVDHYNNLTLKSLATLEWFDTYCPKAKFLLKADDDLFVNVDNLMTFIEHHKDERRVIFGNTVYNPKPDRDPASKFYTSPEIWSKPSFPKYVGGPIYLMSNDVPRRVFDALMKRPYLFIEDVAVTGIGAQLAGVRRRRAPEMFTYPVPSADTCRFRLLIAAHQIPTEDLDGIWQHVMDPELLCHTPEYSVTLWEPCARLKDQERMRHCMLVLFATSGGDKKEWGPA